MDFRQFVTEYFSEKLDRDPSSLADGGMQELLDLSRKQDLDSREEQLSEADDQEEVMEVDTQPLETAGPAQRQEPATDSAYLPLPLAPAGEPLPMEESITPHLRYMDEDWDPDNDPYMLLSTEVEEEVEEERELEERYEAVTDEDILPPELTDMSSPEGEAHAEINFRTEVEILGAEDVDFDLKEAITRIENDLMKDGDEVSISSGEIKTRELTPIPGSVYQEFNRVVEALDRGAQALLDGERRT